METSLRTSINQAICDLKDINLRITNYNQGTEESEELEVFLEKEQKRLMEFLTENSFGPNVAVLRN